MNVYSINNKTESKCMKCENEYENLDGVCQRNEECQLYIDKQCVKTQNIETYVDELQIKHTTYTYKCEHCDFTIIEDFFNEEVEDCYYYSYMIQKFYYGSTLIVSTPKIYSHSEYIHNYKSTYSFVAGEDCEEGLNVTRICEGCGDEYVDTYNHHDTEYEVERLDFSSIEGLCDGYAEKGICLCGKEYNKSYDYNCNFELESINTNRDVLPGTYDVELIAKPKKKKKRKVSVKEAMNLKEKSYELKYNANVEDRTFGSPKLKKE